MKETKELNLCEILKDCPKGTKLYSPIIGECKLDHITSNLVVVEYENIPGGTLTRSFLKDGRVSIAYYGECILFPSKDNHDWSTFKPKKERFDIKTLKPFTDVIARDYDDDNWRIDIFSDIYRGIHKDCARCIGRTWFQCVPFNDNTEHLIGTNDDAPEYYKWWED